MSAKGQNQRGPTHVPVQSLVPYLFQVSVRVCLCLNLFGAFGELLRNVVGRAGMGRHGDFGEAQE